MKIYLYIVNCLILMGCAPIQKPSSSSSFPTELPKNNLFSLKFDNNKSKHQLSFKLLNLDEGLYDFIDLTLQKNPGWITKLSKLEEVKSGLNFLTNGKKPISTVRLDGLLEKKIPEIQILRPARYPNFSLL